MIECYVTSGLLTTSREKKKQKWRLCECRITDYFEKLAREEFTWRFTSNHWLIWQLVFKNKHLIVIFLSFSNQKNWLSIFCFFHLAKNKMNGRCTEIDYHFQFKNICRVLKKVKTCPKASSTLLHRNLGLNFFSRNIQPHFWA